MTDCELYRKFTPPICRRSRPRRCPMESRPSIANHPQHTRKQLQTWIDYVEADIIDELYFYGIQDTYEASTRVEVLDVLDAAARGELPPCTPQQPMMLFHLPPEALALRGNIYDILEAYGVTERTDDACIMIV